MQHGVARDSVANVNKLAIISSGVIIVAAAAAKL